MDRNQKAKQEFAAAQVRRNFMQAYSSGQAKARDKTGTPLEAGQLVVWIPGQDILYWKVVQEGPALDLPQPAVKVTLTIDVPLILPPGGVMSNLLIVGRHDAVAGEVPDKGGEAQEDGEPPAGEAAGEKEAPSDGPRATDSQEDD